MMKEEKCIICGRKAICRHHTIPTSIYKDWEKTVPVCGNCHYIIHNYILKDIVNWIKENGWINEDDREGIIWINDIGIHKYLRRSKVISHKPLSKKEIISRFSDDNVYKVFGYKLVSSGKNFYVYEVYWLKIYDKDCPKEYLASYKDGSKLPSEAILVEKLLEEV